MSRAGRGEAQLARLLAAHQTYIRDTARRLSDGDRDLADDLEQEALIALWKLDAPLTVAAGERSQFVRTVAVNAMLAFLTWELSRSRPSADGDPDLFAGVEEAPPLVHRAA